MPEARFTRNDLDRLVGRLDAVAEGLSEEEKALLVAIFRLAGEEIARRGGEGVSQFANTGAGELAVEHPEGALPTLSAGFLDALTSGPTPTASDFTHAVEGTVMFGIRF